MYNIFAAQCNCHAGYKYCDEFVSRFVEIYVYKNENNRRWHLKIIYIYILDSHLQTFFQKLLQNLNCCEYCSCLNWKKKKIFTTQLIEILTQSCSWWPVIEYSEKLVSFWISEFQSVFRARERKKKSNLKNWHLTMKSELHSLRIREWISKNKSLRIVPELKQTNSGSFRKRKKNN